MGSLRIGIVTCSDTRSTGEAEDTAGPALQEAAEALGWQVVAYRIVPDDTDAICAAIIAMADDDRADVVLTTGGTGFSGRDVTPEATMLACDREAPGIAEAIRSQSMAVTRRAMLSRGVAALRGSTLVVNFPGSRKGALESFGFISDQLEHGVDMMAGEGHPK
ncbi:MAG: MogA/MoaB family molybdenum cofactor biosynthesis protein [Actinobacteria bacterium]|nr:MogA/MoaB family molybdenum cofactor biosynthesis protein [Actinomycetota bacterium]MCG2808034.1 MogA/MoaB family molybdenum cofactor biosynthesis protein [Coriobacteriia bacterium]